MADAERLSPSQHQDPPLEVGGVGVPSRQRRRWGGEDAAEESRLLIQCDTIVLIYAEDRMANVSPTIILHISLFPHFPRSIKRLV